VQTNVNKKYDINARILQLIDFLAIGRNQFAREIGISSSRMSNVATNRNKPDSEMLQLILNRYRNVSSDWLLLGKGEMIKEVIEENTLKEPEKPYGKEDCKGCKEKQKQIEKLNETVSILLDQSVKDRELIRQLITEKQEQINKQSRSA
jgi:transcriptional regulator with XRE-family HTH domain